MGVIVRSRDTDRARGQPASGSNAPESRLPAVDFTRPMADLERVMFVIDPHRTLCLAPSPARAITCALDPTCLGTRVPARRS